MNYYERRAWELVRALGMVPEDDPEKYEKLSQALEALNAAWHRAIRFGFNDVGFDSDGAPIAD
jgi:hypothetical protein